MEPYKKTIAKDSLFLFKNSIHSLYGRENVRVGKRLCTFDSVHYGY
jgi:hypothetical protein